MRGSISDIVTQEISHLLATHITHILATPINANEKFSQQGWGYVCMCYVAACGAPAPLLDTALVNACIFTTVAIRC